MKFVGVEGFASPVRIWRVVVAQVLWFGPGLGSVFLTWESLSFCAC